MPNSRVDNPFTTNARLCLAPLGWRSKATLPKVYVQILRLAAKKARAALTASSAKLRVADSRLEKSLSAL